MKYETVTAEITRQLVEIQDDWAVAMETENDNAAARCKGASDALNELWETLQDVERERLGVTP